MSKRPPDARFTAFTEAQLILQDEETARAAATAADLSDDDLRQRVAADLDGLRSNDPELGKYLPDPAMMSRQDMIEYVAQDNSGWPITEAIPATADDPLVLIARKLRREQWEGTVSATIKVMGLEGAAAAQHRAAAEEAELAYLRRLVEETWSLPEAELRGRALEIINELAGGSEGEKAFRQDPSTLSRGLLCATATYIFWLSSAPELFSRSSGATA
jgi:hypothetical protein